MTKADEGVAPTVRGATQIVTHGSPSGAVDVPELTHEEIRGQLSDYLDDALAESDRRRVEGHLASCPSCARDHDSLRAIVKGLSHLPAPKAPARARAQILEQARRERDTDAAPQPRQQPAVADE
ncbi:MAG: zf-HC2 domain-containing protein [Chloroflexota bacterium]